MFMNSLIFKTYEYKEAKYMDETRTMVADSSTSSAFHYNTATSKISFLSPTQQESHFLAPSGFLHSCPICQRPNSCCVDIRTDFEKIAFATQIYTVSQSY